MKKTPLLILPIVFLLFNLSFQTASYGQLNKAMRKFEKAKSVQGTKKGKRFNTSSLGYGIAYTSFAYSHSYDVYDEFDQYLGAGEFTHQFKSKGPNIVTNTYFTIANLNDQLDLNFNFGANVSGFIAHTPLYEVPHTKYIIEIQNLVFSFPLSIELVHGGLASMNKKDKTSLTVGFGAAPIINMTEVGFNPHINLNVAPYFKLTAGFFAGIQWQFYLEYIAGTNRIYSTSISSETVTLDRSSGILAVGLRISPFSFLWDNRF